ncbi:MAG TPA: twin-arginine translocase TatA/TatE family subunit [bacterium]|nr:twin-arginine translocase TatA/TatE family subunit [bacterium]
MGRIGTTEILLIIVAILILFGGKRIPELMRSLGSGVREFKKGMTEGEEQKPASEAKPPTETKPPSEVKPS